MRPLDVRRNSSGDSGVVSFEHNSLPLLATPLPVKTGATASCRIPSVYGRDFRMSDAAHPMLTAGRSIFRSQYGFSASNAAGAQMLLSATQVLNVSALIGGIMAARRIFSISLFAFGIAALSLAGVARAADSDGSEAVKLADYVGTTYGGLDWTADGKTIVFSALARDGVQLFAVPRAGGPLVQLTHDSGNLMHPRVSPDGKWIACTRLVQSKQIWRRPLS